MTSTADRADLALAPLREELLRAAHAEAEAILAAARRAADAEVAAARGEADRLVDAAREAGARAGRVAARATLEQARGTARTRELAARRELFDTLRREVAQRLKALTAGPAYADLRAALAARARHLLGPDAVLTESPGGGLIADTPDRSVDLSFTALAESAVEGDAAAVEGLWAP